MSVCNTCSADILFGGVQEGGLSFCGRGCQERDRALALAAEKITPEVLERRVAEVHAGPCPRCKRVVPVDIHMSYRNWAAVFVSGTIIEPEMCCRRCGLLSQIGSLLFCLLLGWWSIPGGVLATPFNIFRNLVAMAAPPDRSRPSDALAARVQMDMAAAISCDALKHRQI